MYIKIIPILFASSLLAVGCQQQNNVAAPSIDKNDAVVVVNGKYISKSTFELVKKEAQQSSRGKAIQDEQLLQELIKMELLVQDAEQKKLNDNPDLIQRMTMVRRGLLSQAAVQDYIKSNPVADSEIKAEYDKQISTKGGSEYKARHILVKTEEEAKSIVVELDKGGDFVAIATAKSTGPSAKKGGDLGWFAPARMVPPFSEAVIALENGKYTATPVQTQFGWHVIFREDSRDITPPSFDSVKEQIRPMLQRQKVQDYLAALRSKAKIEILMPKKVETPPAIPSPASETKLENATEPPKPEEESIADEKIAEGTN